MPVPVRSGQTRHLHPEDQSDVAQSDLRHQPLKAEPAFDARARTAEIVIDDDYALASPAEMEGAIDQSVLQRVDSW